MTLYAQPGYSSDQTSFLQVLDDDNWHTVSEKYTLRFLPDTNEIILTKGDEVVYSELLP